MQLSQPREPLSRSEPFEGFLGEVSQDFADQLQISAAASSASSSRDGGLVAETVQEEDAGAGDEPEFTFDCTNPDGSPIAADTVFHNGLIRPTYPLFDRSLLFADPMTPPPVKKVFVEESLRHSPSSSSSSGEEDDAGENELAGLPEGTYCVWNRRAGDNDGTSEPAGCKKSNSTGFSKLWRVRDLVLRSSSDGKDAFVYLKPSGGNNLGVKTGEKVDKREAEVTGGKMKDKAAAPKKRTTSLSAHYAQGRATREGERRKSYLPYRPELVGFFTSANGLSRNVHPF